MTGKVILSFAYGVDVRPGGSIVEDEENTLGELAFETTTEAFLTRSLGVFSEPFPNPTTCFN